MDLATVRDLAAATPATHNGVVDLPLLVIGAVGMLRLHVCPSKQQRNRIDQ